MSASCKLMPSAKPKADVSDSALITLGISFNFIGGIFYSKGKNLYFVGYVIYQSIIQMSAYPNFAVDCI